MHQHAPVHPAKLPQHRCLGMLTLPPASANCSAQVIQYILTQIYSYNDSKYGLSFGTAALFYPSTMNTQSREVNILAIASSAFLLSTSSSSLTSMAYHILSNHHVFFSFYSLLQLVSLSKVRPYCILNKD